jgi:hypothetical protein
MGVRLGATMDIPVIKTPTPIETVDHLARLIDGSGYLAQHYT